MPDYTYFRTIRLSERHRWTGNYSAAGPLPGGGWGPQPPPAALTIVQLHPPDGFYLLYLDAAGEEMNDTFHDTLDDAMHHAEFALGVRPDVWTVVERTT